HRAPTCTLSRNLSEERTTVIRYTAQRILFIIPVALLVSFMTFMIVHIIPGDPARILLGEFATPQELVALRQQLGLDKPLLQQFVIWLWQLFHGNLGQSIQLQQPVLDAITQRFPVTAELGICSLLFSLVIAFPLGIYSATHRNSALDWIMNVLILLSTAIPSFVLGLVLIFIFAVTIRIFPAGGYVPFNQDPLNNIRDLILPMVALGMGARRINYSHALRNAVIPVLTIIGIQVGSIIAGTFVIETIYLWPGVGQLAVTSIFSKDYPVIQGIVLLSAFFY